MKTKKIIGRVIAVMSLLVMMLAAGAISTPVIRITAAANSQATISFAGKRVNVVPGNLKVKSAPRQDVAQTWGGQTHLSVTDNQSTHMIAHNDTVFGPVKHLKKGASIKVHDMNGHDKTYHVFRIANVDDWGRVPGTKTNWYFQIIKADLGEQIVLQTCLSKTMNRVVWAR